MDPKQMAKLMSQMGIKNEPIPASRVIVEKEDGSKLVVNNPSVTLIEMQGQKSLQVAGEFAEEKGEQGPSDAEVVMQAVSGASKEEAEKALKEADGDIAQAVLILQDKASADRE
ncbi:Nascent polypeptide-associated complex protein [Candidatus Micrarchaeota archaeon]|nr:Nascent polypeptide-associated complex protein [Candidatus Micrarchaeota archaeon]